MLYELITEVGPIASVLLFFVWRDYMREKYLTIRNEALQKQQMQLMSDLVSQTKDCVERNTEASTRLYEALSARPCLKK